MKPQFSFGFILVVIVLVVAGGAGVWSQWLQTMALRTELDSAQAEAAQLARLRAENQRLCDRQIPPAQLAALRADHVALPQLRAEVEALNQRPATAPP